QAARCGTAGGLGFRGRAVSFGELAEATDDLARWLAGHRVGAGRTVGVLAGNEPAGVATLYAPWGLGAVAVSISTRPTAEEMARLLRHARAAALVADLPRADVAREAAAIADVLAVGVETDIPVRPAVLRGGGLRRTAIPRPPGPSS